MQKIDVSLLLSLGMKDELINKLDEKQKEELVSFAMNHTANSNVLQMLIQLASMEINGKNGATFLAIQGIATPLQLKNLSANKIKQTIDEFNYHNDINLITRKIKMILINEQQDKLYMRSFGFKGGHETNHISQDSEAYEY